MITTVWSSDGKRTETLEGPICPAWLVSDGDDMAQRIMVDYCAKHHVDVSDIMGASRKRYLVIRRHRIISKIRKETALSLPEIGKLMNRDHSTILYAIYKSSWTREKAND